jgi:hypothetical protein
LTTDTDVAFPSFVQFQVAIHPMYAFVIPTPALAPQALKQLWKSFLRSLMGQLHKQLNQLAVTVRSAAIAINRASKVHRRASAPFAKSMLVSQRHYQFAPDRRRYSFFAITSFSARFSSNKSAEICFNRRFSSSSSRRRLMSEACMPPYFDFH